MTTTQTDPRPAPTTRVRPQWVTVGRLLAGEALHHLLWAVGVMVAIIVVGSLVARWRGWEIVPVGAGPGDLFVQVTADDVGVRVVASWVIVVVGVGIAAIVNQVVLASRTRVLVAAGATRRSVATGLVLSAVAMTVVLLLLAGVALAVFGDELGDAGPLPDTGAVLLVRLAGSLLLGMGGGMLVVALFQRWHWWVGTVVLAALIWVVPVVLALTLPSVWAAVEAAAGWWGWELSLAVVALGLYWLVARHVPVP